MAAAAAALAAGCGGQSGPSIPAGSSDPPPGRSPISHVVIIIQENRTVDNIFRGFPGADTVDAGTNSKGQRVPLRPVSMTAPYDLSHSHTGFLTEYANGGMNGFDRVHSNCTHHTGQPKCPPRGDRAYAYLPRSEVQPYWEMARQYTLADDTFETDQGRASPRISTSSAARRSVRRTAFARARTRNTVTAPLHRRLRLDRNRSSSACIDERATRTERVYPCFDRTLADGAGESARQLALLPGAAARRLRRHAPDAIEPIRSGPIVRPTSSRRRRRSSTDVARRPRWRRSRG